MNLDPITRLIMDANGDRSGLTPEQQAEREAQDRIAREKDRVRPAIGDLYRLIEAGHAAYGIPQDVEHDAKTWFVTLLDHYLFAAYVRGRMDGAEAVADALQSEVRAKVSQYTDTGDGVPLAVIGPGGDYTREVRP